MLTESITPQIIIKEKVDINPQGEILPDYPLPEYTPCGPWIIQTDSYNPYQVIWNDAYFYLDPYQQLFNFQANGYDYAFTASSNYNVEITEGAGYCYISKAGYTDPNTGQYVPPTSLGSSISGVEGSELIGYGDGWWLHPVWHTYQKEIPSLYTLNFSRDIPAGSEVTCKVTELSTGAIIYYHTRIETPLMRIENGTPADTLLHYYSRDILINAVRVDIADSLCDIYGSGGAILSGVKYTLEIIEGQQYGIIYDKLTRESGTYFSNIESDYGTGSLFDYRFEFKANGIQPDISTAGTVKIKCSPNDVDLATVVFSIPVAYNTDPPNEGGEVLVNFNKTIFAPGDSAVTNCQWLTEYNEIIDFPPEQYFTVEILDGSEYGVLYDPYSGTTSNYLQDVNNSFQVLTSAEIPGDSAKLKIRVTTLVDVNQPAGSIKSGDEEEQKAKKNGEGINPNFVVIGEQIEGFADVLVKKDGCDEEIVVCDNSEPQTFDPTWIEIYRHNSYFDYDLVDPLNPNYIVQGCQLKKSNNVQGVTFIIPGFPLGKTWNQKYDWQSHTSAKIRLCLYDVTNRWLIRFDELRIPIFSSACIEGYVDLGDGLNSSLLSLNIKDMNDYNTAIDDLNYWWIGSYSQINKAPKKFAFSSGILKHEYKHFQIDSSNVDKKFNSYFHDLNNLILDKAIYPCPGDVLAVKEDVVRRDVFSTISECYLRFDNLSDKERRNEELVCDEFARSEYDSIKSRINQWASNQNWYNP